MAKFVTVATALKLGQSVRRQRWEPVTRAFIQNGHFVCQRGSSEPYSYQLSWREINAADWTVIEEPSTAS